MSLFVCWRCGNLDNTALSISVQERIKKLPLKCSKCKAEKWHNEFKEEHIWNYWQIRMSAGPLELIDNTYPYESFDYWGDIRVLDKNYRKIYEASGMGTVMIAPKIYASNLTIYGFNKETQKELNEKFGYHVPVHKGRSGTYYFYLR